jgi:CHAT domain-containing protein/Tfp pilus assembly protein PilF
MMRSCPSCAVVAGIAAWSLAAVFAASYGAPVLLAQGPVPPPTGPAAAIQATTVANPEEITMLEPGMTIERELAGVKRDLFQVALSQGQLASIIVAPSAIDLTLRLLDAEGTVRVAAETHPRQAQDVLEFVADKSGAYQIQIQPIYPKAPAGKYRLRIGGVRAANEKDVVLYEARRQYSDALNLYRTGAYDKAQLKAEHALGLREKTLGPDHAEVAASLNTLGLICSARGDYNRAEGLFQRALAVYDKAFGKGSLAAAEVDDSLAQNYNAKANFAEAERLAREALGVREKSLGADHFLVGASLSTLGEIFLAKAEYSTARPFAERALETTGKSYSPGDLPYTDAVSLLARVQIRQSSFDSAEQLLLQNLHNRETAAGAESLPAANALQDLGSLYVFKIDNVKAEQMNLRALALKEKILGRDHVQVSLILHNLGLIYYRRGDYSTADTYYQRALAIKEKVLGPTHPLVAPTLNNLGLMYWRQLEYAKAADYFRRGLEIVEKAYGPESIEVTYGLANLGIIAKETGDYDTAEDYYKRSLAISEKVLGPQNPQTGLFLESLGILYRDKGDYARAEPLLLRTIAITEGSRGAEHPDVVRELRNLTQLYQASGDVANALKSYQRLSFLEEKNLPLNLAVGSERQKLAYFDPFVGSMEKVISFQAQYDPGNAQARDLAATALVSRKGRVLDAMADSLSTLWSRSSAKDRAVLDQLKEVTSKLAALVLNGPQRLSIEEHQERIKSLAAQREQLENEAARASDGYYERTQAINLAAVQAAIPPTAALIELGVYRPFDAKKSFESHKQFGDPRYIAYVVPSQGEVRSRDLGPAKDIDAAVNAFRQGLRDPQRQDVKRLAGALDEKIMRPVRALTGDATHLLVSPDGQLDLIPFEALVDEKERYLLERFSITYLTTGRDLLRMQVRRASKSGPLVMADPTFGEPETTTMAKAEGINLRPQVAAHKRRSITTGQDLSAVYFAPLSDTAQEARSIQTLFPDARVLTGTQATKAALKQVDAPRILHIATHGFFLQDAAADASPAAGKPEANNTRAIHASARIENPLLRSGLALSGANLTKSSSEDGILTALEAANLNLWGTKLVTLSACETGVGEVKNLEGVYGLRRSFFLAGAESLVMSLWPVSDRVTREMMTGYYSGLKRGLGRSDALRQAQLAMLKRKGREHPFYWASFIQSGEWANLDGQR